MDKKSINQNESIQEGLEKFLDEQFFAYEAKKEKTLKTEFASEPFRNRVTEQEKNVANAAKGSRMREDDLAYDDAYENAYENVAYEEDFFVDEQERPARREQRSHGQASRSVKKQKSSSYHREWASDEKKKKAGRQGKKRTRKESVKEEGDKKKRKRPSKVKKVITILVLIFLAVSLWWYFMVGTVYKKMNHDATKHVASGPMKEDGVTNILLIGNDSRKNGDDGRSDAMILLSISNKTQTIHMTSLLRDMYVDIPGHDPNRLNAAYAYGGASLLCETVEKNLGITVNRYVIVNFQAFASLVDAVGGVDLEVTSEEVTWINAYLNEYNLLENRELTTDYLDTSKSGMLHLNGPQALAYSRNRYIGTDFGRTQRQRKVLDAVMKKLPLAMATNSKTLIDELFPNLTTNLSRLECYRLSLDASKLLSYDIVQNVIPKEGTYSNVKIRKMAVLEVDFEANRKFLRQEIYKEE